MLMEFHEVDQRLRIDREERMHDSARANRELVRNLAHEIKNPLGGIRGAAQLLEAELTTPELREYTQVMIKEADRLQKLVDRLLAPHRPPRPVEHVNVHEVCERVRSHRAGGVSAGLAIDRDYDASLPEAGRRQGATDPGASQPGAQRRAGARRARASSGCAPASPAMWSLPGSGTSWHWNCMSSTMDLEYRAGCLIASSFRWCPGARVEAGSACRLPRLLSSSTGV